MVAIRKNHLVYGYHTFPITRHSRSISLLLATSAEKSQDRTQAHKSNALYGCVRNLGSDGFHFSMRVPAFPMLFVPPAAIYCHVSHSHFMNSPPRQVGWYQVGIGVALLWSIRLSQLSGEWSRSKKTQKFKTPTPKQWQLAACISLERNSVVIASEANIMARVSCVSVGACGVAGPTGDVPKGGRTGCASPLGVFRAHAGRRPTLAKITSETNEIHGNPQKITSGLRTIKALRLACHLGSFNLLHGASCE